MSRGRGVRGKAQRALCPECGRNTAVYVDRHALLAGAGITYLLQPHNARPGKTCRGWRVGRAALVTATSSAAVRTEV
jgi:hypothetical protein